MARGWQEIARAREGKREERGQDVQRARESGREMRGHERARGRVGGAEMLEKVERAAKGGAEGGTDYLRGEHECSAEEHLA